MEGIISARRSSRNYDRSRPIPKEIIIDLLDAARYAASSRNLQPWRYIVIDERTPQARSKMIEFLSQGNKRWAPDAPVFILSFTRTQFEGRPYPVGLHDLGLANQNLMLQAIAHGLNIRPMGGFDKDAARQYFDIPSDFTLVCTFAIGYPGDPSDLDEDIRKKENSPRQRKSIGEIAYLGSLNNSIDIIK